MVHRARRWRGKCCFFYFGENHFGAGHILSQYTGGKTISLPDALSQINTAVGKKFIIIIDEWDVLIRDESANAKVQKDYINFLRGMFKGTEPTKYILLAYLTGILPIKKEKRSLH